MFKNPLFIFGTVIIIAILAIGAFTLSQSQQTPSVMTEQDSLQAKTVSTVSTDEPATDNSVATDNPARYVEYSEGALESSSGNRRVLFFYANWCPTCRPADSDFRTNSDSIPQDVTVIRVNYNDTETAKGEKDLAAKYGITYQHTFVQIDPTGEEVTKWNGGGTKELISKIR